MARGENLYASGIVLVTPLELEVLEEADSGRVRVVVRDASTKDLVPKVQVKVIGTDNPTFFSGQTDLRGVYVAEGVSRPGDRRRPQGCRPVRLLPGDLPRRGPAGPAPSASPRPAPAAAEKPAESQSLDKNLKKQNTSNQMRQLDRLQNRYKRRPRA